MSTAANLNTLDTAVLGRAARADQLVSAVEKLLVSDAGDFGRLRGAPRGYLRAVLQIVLTDLGSIKIEADAIGAETIGELADCGADNLRELLAAVERSAR